MVMEKFGKALDNMIRRIRKLPRIDKDALNLVIQDLQRALLSADVNVEICLALTENIRTRAFNEKIADSIARKDFIIKLIHDELVTLLGGAHTPRKLKSNRLNILLMVGIQGSGKTTTVGKLAQYYRNNGFKLGVICVDTWRPGAYQQLQQLLDPLKIPLYGDLEEKNALRLAKKGIRYFTNEKVDIIIVDTAGRHKEETALMNEVQKMEKMIKPDEVILVIDGSLGQQAFAQAKAFSEATHVGSIIVTKMDGSAKGGGALSAVAATGAPIKFIGVGEKTEALEDFVPTVFVGNLLGIPDIGGILQKIKEAEIEPDKDMVKRLMKGKFTLDDLYQQLESLKRMGPFKKLLSMMGGQNIPDEMKDMAESNLENWKIVLTSMTQYEKENPQVIKKTRIERIAKGSGKSYSDIKGLLKQYDDMKKMISQLTKPRRGKKGLPGMPPGMPDLSKLGM